VLFIVSFAVFGLIKLIPGDAAVQLAGGDNATPQRIAEIRHQLHLNDPFLAQYWRWLSHAVRGDFGRSLISGQSVSAEVWRRFPVTLSIVIGGVVLGILIGVPAGIIAGMRPGSASDRMTMFGTTLGLAVPNFWLAMVMILLFAVKLHWLPAVGYTRPSVSIMGWLRSITLPSIALSIFLMASLARQTRAALADVMSSNYVKTAWAKGGTLRTVVGKHALKNASIPAITLVGIAIAALLGGSVLIEQIFSIPGLGTYVLSAIQSSDLPVIQAVALLFVLVNVVMMLLVDIAYGFVNPKVRVS
jgi:peptide/nickel transport system permease protein